ncbi:Rrf2 family transcriptional regulator [Micromonospora mirobrigensis]|uniref:DNA-binding transcriptional regulator, IscR family n=1 Tax=Micromonospora mirobrigensis TaxID=262898 RepID=A0A1C4Y8N4_9ACTN|nr:Rrf2 family transcriptional regulator [Micromonospora mirobrigensis]SCF17064.1 DNA-binding transcriptional regulator, IscR family [Micromonospora mirobrigensis]
MAGNSRLTVAVHALCWLALAQRHGHTGLTSDQIAASLDSNPAAVRRALGPLRDAGMVAAGLGPGGGWSLCTPATGITLAEVYAAVEPGPVFALHPHQPRQDCPVGYGIAPVLDDIYDRVGRAVAGELSRRTIADVLDTVLRRHPLPVPWAGVPAPRDS